MEPQRPGPQSDRVTLRHDEARLDAIVSSAMDAIITVDSAQRVLIFNAAAEKMFGCAAADTIGRPLDQFIPERFRSAHFTYVNQFARTGKSTRRMGLQRGLWALRADGTEFPIEASISQAEVGGQKLLTVVLRDLTERDKARDEIERARATLLEGEARLDAIVRSAMDGIITIDDTRRIVLFNAAAEKMFGCTAADALGARLDRFMPERFRGAHDEHVARFAHTGATARRMGMQTALWALRADGTEFPIEASISQATVSGRKLLTVILRDVSERVNAQRQLMQAHEEMRALSVAMLEVREAERTRIARELHDELGQALTALKMDVDLLESTHDPAQVLERARAMRELLDFTVVTTRRISADLRPLVLDDLGLGAAAEWLAQGVQDRSGLKCALQIEPAFVDLGEPHASALFRIMQESLTNVTRHARAQHVAVRLERAGRDALLTVSDDGIGMQRGAQPNKRGSFGLRGINERVLILGGEVNIESAPGRGTKVVARIPLPDAFAPPAA